MVWLLVVLCIGLCLWCGYALGSGSLLPMAVFKRKVKPEAYKEVKVEAAKAPPLSKIDLMKELVDDLIDAHGELRDHWEKQDLTPGAATIKWVDQLAVIEHHYNNAYEKLLAAIKREIK